MRSPPRLKPLAGFTPIIGQEQRAAVDSFPAKKIFGQSGGVSSNDHVGFDAHGARARGVHPIPFATLAPVDDGRDSAIRKATIGVPCAMRNFLAHPRRGRGFAGGRLAAKAAPVPCGNPAGRPSPDSIRWRHDAGIGCCITPDARPGKIGAAGATIRPRTSRVFNQATLYVAAHLFPLVDCSRRAARRSYENAHLPLVGPQPRQASSPHARRRICRVAAVLDMGSRLVSFCLRSCQCFAKRAAAFASFLCGTNGAPMMTSPPLMPRSIGVNRNAGQKPNFRVR